jgi:hypothetical protein
MSKESIIKAFEGVNVRIVWDAEAEEYYFCVNDIVQVLTESADPKDYIKKMLKRDPELKSKWGTICPPVRMLAPDGKFRMTKAATLQGILRIVQNIPSRKAEPLKQWLAEIGSQRINQMIDPELAFQMAVQDYRRLGYSEKWITQRMRSIEVRKALTDEWQRSGVKNEREFAILTNILTKAWSGMTTGQYKQYKGLTKQNLRDNMTNLEMTLNMLAEGTAAEISNQENPQGFGESAGIAQRGGEVALGARKLIEKELGRSVVSPLNAKDYLNTLESEEAKQLGDDSEEDVSE